MSFWGGLQDQKGEDHGVKVSSGAKADLPRPSLPRNDTSRQAHPEVLSPKQPPPTRNVFHNEATVLQSPSGIQSQETRTGGPPHVSPPPFDEDGSNTATSQNHNMIELPQPGIEDVATLYHQQKSPLRHLTKKRLLDPVFKSPEATFPLLVDDENQPAIQGNQGPTNQIHIFMPTASHGEDQAGVLTADNAGDTMLSGRIGATEETQSQTLTETISQGETGENDRGTSCGETEVYAIQTRAANVKVNEKGGKEEESSGTPQTITPEEFDSDPVEETFAQEEMDSSPTEEPNTLECFGSAPPAVEEPYNPETFESAPVEEPRNMSGMADPLEAGVGVQSDFSLSNAAEAWTLPQEEDGLDMTTQQSTSFDSSENSLRGKASKVILLNDQDQLPINLKRIQERSMRRRRDLLNKMHNLECQVATISSKFAEEKMDLHLAINHTTRTCIYNPLEAAMERHVVERSSLDRASVIQELERRLTQLDSEATRHLHVALGDAKREKLDRASDVLYQDIIPGIRVENAKSDKIEGGVVGRYEMISGEMAKKFHGESSTRMSTLAMMERRTQTIAERGEKNLDDILSTIAELRVQIRVERNERMAADKRILGQIARSTTSMKRAILAAIGANS